MGAYAFFGAEIHRGEPITNPMAHGFASMTVGETEIITGTDTKHQLKRI